MTRAAEAVTAATPLTMMTKGGELSDELPSLVDMLHRHTLAAASAKPARWLL